MSLEILAPLFRENSLQILEVTQAQGRVYEFAIPIDHNGAWHFVDAVALQWLFGLFCCIVSDNEIIAGCVRERRRLDDLVPESFASRNLRREEKHKNTAA